MRNAVAIVLLLGGCSSPAPAPAVKRAPEVAIDESDEVPSDEVPSEPPLAGAVAAPPTPELRMHRVRFKEGAMALEVVDRPHATHAWDRGGVLTQTIALAEHHALRIVVRVGEGEELAGFTSDHDDAQLTKRAATTVCGAPAVTLEAHEKEQHITCIKYADGRPNSPGFIPAETTKVVAFARGALGATATWSIPTALRGRYAKLEKRFFDSFRCP